MKVFLLPFVLALASCAAVVSFDTSARRHSGLVGDPAALRDALARMTTTPGTHIDLGLAEARAVLEKRRVSQ